MLQIPMQHPIRKPVSAGDCHHVPHCLLRGLPAPPDDDNVAILLVNVVVMHIAKAQAAELAGAADADSMAFERGFQAELLATVAAQPLLPLGPAQ